MQRAKMDASNALGNTVILFISNLLQARYFPQSFRQVVEEGSSQDLDLRGRQPEYHVSHDLLPLRKGIGIDPGCLTKIFTVSIAL